MRKKGEKCPPGESRGKERLTRWGDSEKLGYANINYMTFIVGLAHGACLLAVGFS